MAQDITSFQGTKGSHCQVLSPHPLPDLSQQNTCRRQFCPKAVALHLGIQGGHQELFYPQGQSGTYQLPETFDRSNSGELIPKEPTLVFRAAMLLAPSGSFLLPIPKLQLCRCPHVHWIPHPGSHRRTHSTQTSALSPQSTGGIHWLLKGPQSFSVSPQAQSQRSLPLPHLRHTRYTKDFCGQRMTS